MARLIDADKLVRRMGIDSNDRQIFFVTGKDIDGQPTVDAVEVVRCKDCKFYEAHRNRPGGYCWHWEYEEGMSPNMVEDDDFCSYGERRDKDAVD